MNPYTGDVIRIGADYEEIARALTAKFERLPQELEAAAAAALGDKQQVRVDLRAPGPLQDWAKKKRKEKIAAKSRRINRR
jgi:uncharacterized membrane protein YccC